MTTDISNLKTLPKASHLPLLELCDGAYQNLEGFRDVVEILEMPVTAIAEIEASSEPWQKAYYLVSEGTQYVVVRGSNDPLDWLKSNFKVLKVARDWYSGRCHRGFVRGAEALFYGIFDAGSMYAEKSQRELPLIFLGHSLGGAIAVLMAHKFCSKYPALSANAQVATFGAPRIGTKRWAQNYPLNDRTIQYRNVPDVVTRLLYSVPSIPYFSGFLDDRGLGYWHPLCHPILLWPNGEWAEGATAAWEHSRTSFPIPLQDRNRRSLPYVWEKLQGLLAHMPQAYRDRLQAIVAEEKISSNSDQKAQ